MPPTRPVLRYHGGKWRLAPWIISHFPPHRVYVEPFGGAASVLLRKPRSYAEVYNDLDDEVVTLFRVLRDPPQAARLIELVRLTPFARKDFEASYAPSDDPLERSRRLIVRAYMGFGSDGHNGGTRTGFRANTNHSHTTPASDWRNLPEGLEKIVERLRGVVIEHRDAVEIMRQHDGPATLHYVDPPYLFGTRSPKARRNGERYHVYRHELTDVEHETLARHLHDLEGAVVLSGYPSALYERLYGDWSCIERAALADGARPRVEALWLNPAAAAGVSQGQLFETNGRLAL